ncbi:MAG: 2-amino-4-hydroxy-6-hydroxymethyldihydropteridine diphosphokinase [Candidatus Latescibacteria bacterium]|nr:2-amino-4-hydroxy-6-hydroxymethyldihydropteridine diphosphokinase [Candidatus Latescibacterota bacterium]
MKAYLGLGSNIGNRFENLNEAVRLLNEAAEIRVMNVSKIYETVPVGGPEQPDYLNAAVEIETTLEPATLYQQCSTIERALGRVRMERYGPRIIDIDIVLYEQLVVKTDDLNIPHPQMHERAFVLCPLADLAPDCVHPVLGLTVSELLECVNQSGVQKIDKRVTH